MKTTVWCVLLSLLLASMPALPSDPPGEHRPFVDFGQGSSGLNEDPLPEPPTCPESVEFSENPEVFRWQAIDFFRQIEADLATLMNHPILQSVQHQCVAATEIDIGAEMERALLAMNAAEIEQFQSILSQVPDVASVHSRLDLAIQQLPMLPMNTPADGECPDAVPLWGIYTTRAVSNGVAIAAAILDGVYDGISPWASSAAPWFAGAASILAGVATVAEVASIGLVIAADSMQYFYEIRKDCLAANKCDEDPRTTRPGRGCDGRDSDCDDDQDECDEDKSAPVVSVLRTVESRCYSTLAQAMSAVERHATASDDCRPAVIQAAVHTPPIVDCRAEIEITAKDADCDGLQNESPPVETILTIDGTPPLVTCQVQLGTLWPATRNFVDVGLSYTAVDACDSDLEIELAVTSDEPTATGFMAGAGIENSPDAQIIPLGNGQFQLLLRAERSSSPHGNGRVYRARVQATDSCGNTSSADCLVLVPLNVSPSSAINSGQVFDATAVN